MQIEKLKADLQIAAAERSIRYSKMFDRTAEAIVTMYQKLFALYYATHEYTQVLKPADPLRAEKFDAFKRKADDFMEYFYPNAIFLPPDTGSKAKDFYRY